LITQFYQDVIFVILITTPHATRIPLRAAGETEVLRLGDCLAHLLLKANQLIPSPIPNPFEASLHDNESEFKTGENLTKCGPHSKLILHTFIWQHSPVHASHMTVVLHGNIKTY